MQVFLSVLIMAAAQFALKRGADSAVAQSWFDITQLRSGWVWIGIIGTIGSLVCWLNALRTISLSVAYNLAGLQHILVPLGSWWLLGEHIAPKQWLGIALVFAGVLIIAPAVAQAEEHGEEKKHP